MSHKNRNLIILLIAMACLLFGVTIEHPMFTGSAAGDSVIFNSKSLAALAKEVAFALLIAFLIITGIETESRRADQESADRLRREIALEVFKGVFSNKLPRSYIDLVVGLNLQPPLIRDHMLMNFVIDPFPASDSADIDFDPGEYVLLKCHLEFCLTNPNPRRVEERVSFRNALLSGKKRKYCKIDKFLVGDTRTTLTDKLSLLETSELYDQAHHEYLLGLASGESKHLVMEWILLKEISDNHVWASYHPTLRTEISLSMRVHDLLSGCRFSTASPGMLAYQADDGSFFRWEVDGPSLANDSFVLWWRNE